MIVEAEGSGLSLAVACKERDVLVSIVVPFFNEVAFLPRAIGSILENPVEGVGREILICNDGPLDEETIRSHLPPGAVSCTVILTNFHSKGPGGARNTGLDWAQGDVIAFLDADDWWMAGKLERQLKLIEEGASFVVTGYGFDVGAAVVTPPKSIDSCLEVFTKRGIGTSTVVLTSKLVGETRFSDLRFSQDIDYWYRLAQKEEFRFAAVPMIAVEYHSAGSTKNKLIQLAYTYKVLRRNNIRMLDKVKVLSSYIYSGLVNHYLKKI